MLPSFQQRLRRRRGRGRAPRRAIGSAWLCIGNGRLLMEWLVFFYSRRPGKCRDRKMIEWVPLLMGTELRRRNRYIYLLGHRCRSVAFPTRRLISGLAKMLWSSATDDDGEMEFSPGSSPQPEIFCREYLVAPGIVSGRAKQLLWSLVYHGGMRLAAACCSCWCFCHSNMLCSAWACRKHGHEPHSFGNQRKRPKMR